MSRIYAWLAPRPVIVIYGGLLLFFTLASLVGGQSDVWHLQEVAGVLSACATVAAFVMERRHQLAHSDWPRASMRSVEEDAKLDAMVRAFQRRRSTPPIEPISSAKSKIESPTHHAPV
jgi:hypothetical protein